MCAEWKKEYRPDLLATLIEQIKQPSATVGQVSFRGFEFQDYVTVLCSAANLSNEIPEIEKHGIINGAVFSAAKKGAITPQSLLKELSASERIYLQKKEIPFVLATKVSIADKAKLAKIRMGAATITFSPQLPPRFTKARAKIETNAAHHFIRPASSKFLTVRIRVSGRTASDAVNKALNEFDLLRGIWNLGLIMKNFRVSSGQKRAVNQIVLGQIHTLHDPTGRLSVETFWYEPEFDEYSLPYDWSKTDDKMRVFVRKVRGKLKRCPYKDALSEGIIRYVRALDYRDLNTAFLKLWGVLEFLTDTLKDNYEKTVKRAAFLYQHNDYHRQVLTHLREQRNKSVHTGTESAATEALVYQLKRYVEELIVFHLDEGKNFATIKEATEFLDLPIDKHLLNKRLALYTKAIKFRS